MKYLLGIDVGTTGTKTLLFSTDGKMLGRAYRSYPLSTPAVGLGEQNAEDWWNAIKDTVRELCESTEIAENVVAISLSTQGGTFVPTDENAKPLRPAIVWNDTRAVSQRMAFEEECGGDKTMYNTTGWHLGNILPALGIRWLSENEPEVFSKAKYFLSVPDYISMKMTGKPVVDISNAGINQLCNIKEQAYDKRILEFCGAEESRLGKISLSGELIGNLTENAAKELGLTTKTVLVSGAHDQYAVALGAGALKSGDILIGSGTCWVLTALSDSPDFESGLSQSVSAVPGLWGSVRSLSSGGICLDWLRNQISYGKELTYDEINEESAKRKAAEDGLFFFPFAGKSDNKERLKRASFVGLDLSHDRFDMALAVMEGVVFQILWMMEEFRAKPSEKGIILSGGASKSPLWAKLVADISGLPVRIPVIADLACVGAAIMAGAGSGIYNSVEDGYSHLAVEEKVIYPDAEKHKIYASLFEEYKERASAVK